MAHITIVDNGKTVMDIESDVIIASAVTPDGAGPQVSALLNGNAFECAAAIFGTIDAAQRIFDKYPPIRSAVEMIQETPEGRTVKEVETW